MSDCCAWAKNKSDLKSRAVPLLITPMVCSALVGGHTALTKRKYSNWSAAASRRRTVKQPASQRGRLAARRPVDALRRRPRRCATQRRCLALDTFDFYLPRSRWHCARLVIIPPRSKFPKSFVLGRRSVALRKSHFLPRVPPSDEERGA